MNMIKIIPIGTKVTANYKYDGMIIGANIRMKSIIYEVQQTLEDTTRSFWFNDWEITSKHKEYTIIQQCLLREDEK